MSVYGTSMATIEWSQVEAVYCYILPMKSELHIVLHISFFWNYDKNLDEMIVKANEPQVSIKEGEIGSIMIDVSFLNNY